MTSPHPPGGPTPIVPIYDRVNYQRGIRIGHVGRRVQEDKRMEWGKVKERRNLVDKERKEGKKRMKVNIEQKTQGSNGEMEER